MFAEKANLFRYGLRVCSDNRGSRSDCLLVESLSLLPISDHFWLKSNLSPQFDRFFIDVFLPGRSCQWLPVYLIWRSYRSVWQRMTKKRGKWHSLTRSAPQISCSFQAQKCVLLRVKANSHQRDSWVERLGAFCRITTKTWQKVMPSTRVQNDWHRSLWNPLFLSSHGGFNLLLNDVRPEALCSFFAYFFSLEPTHMHHLTYVSFVVYRFLIEIVHGSCSNSGAFSSQFYNRLFLHFFKNMQYDPGDNRNSMCSHILILNPSHGTHIGSSLLNPLCFSKSIFTIAVIIF